jgi:hypothetical protein
MVRQQRDNALQSNMSGGLNLNSTPLSMELNDSPMLLNVDLLPSGGIEKRKGTRILYRDRYGRYGVSATSLVTTKRNAFIVAKEGTGLSIYYGDDNLRAAIVKPGVFKTTSLREKASVLSYNDGYPRALFLTANTTPIQVTAIELSSPVITSTLVFSNATGFNGVASSSVILIKNGAIQSGYSISYNGTTNVVTVSGLTTDSTATYYLIAFTWQWWAEALQYFGDAFYKTVQRNNSVATADVNVAIPASLRTDLDLSNLSNPSYPIRFYSAASFGSSYTLVANGTAPSGSSQYVFSDGTPWNSGAVVSPSPFFVTFGAVSGTTPFTVHAVRRRSIIFRGDKGQTGANIRVYINGVLATQSVSGSSTAGYGSYYLYDSAQTTILNTSSVASYLSFESSAVIGMGSVNTVEVANSSTQWAGSSAVSTRWTEAGNIDGGFVARPGFGQYADFLNGRFPTFGVVHKERLVLGGLKHQPLLLFFSATSDTRTPGNSFSFFQTTTEYTTNSDPFDILLDNKSDDILVNGATWQDSLFVFTNKRTYRIGTNGTVVFGSATKVISLMEEVGTLNNSSVVATSNGVYFLSYNGVYSVSQQNNVVGQFNVETQSAKIRPVFEALKADRSLWGTAWLSYSELDRKMYVGIGESNLPTDYSHRLYVYGMETGAWTEYYTPGFFRAYTMIQHYQKSILFTSTQNDINNAPMTYVLLRLNEPLRYTDWIDYSDTSLDSTYPFMPLPGVLHTTSSFIREYATSAKKTVQLNGFDTLPLVGVEDATLVLDGTVLEFGTEWVKLSNGNVWLLEAPSNGQTLQIFYKGVI